MSEADIRDCLTGGKGKRERREVGFKERENCRFPVTIESCEIKQEMALRRIDGVEKQGKSTLLRKKRIPQCRDDCLHHEPFRSRCYCSENLKGSSSTQLGTVGTGSRPPTIPRCGKC